MKAEENAYAFIFDHYFFNRWCIVSHIKSQASALKYSNENVTSVAFESKDDPTQMTKIVIYNYILYYIQKTIHSKLICTNVHS